MNRTIVILICAIIAVLLIGGAVFGFKMLGKKQTASTNNPATSQNNKEKGNIFSTIKDAMARNLSIECNIDDSNGKKTVTYMKNGMIRVNTQGATPAEEAHIVMRDNKMYFWNATTGMMMEFNVNEMTNKMATTTPATGTKNPQEYVEMMEKYKKMCKETAVSDDNFVIPTNIKFQDMSQMMKGTQSGTGTNGYVVPTGGAQDYQKMMQQYQNQTQQ